MWLLISFQGKTWDGGTVRNANGFQIHAGGKAAPILMQIGEGQKNENQSLAL